MLGTWKLGAELGAGLKAPITPRVSLLTAVIFHTVAAPSSATGRLQWIDASLGFALGLY
jgi:hypothetical protein